MGLSLDFSGIPHPSRPAKPQWISRMVRFRRPTRRISWRCAVNCSGWRRPNRCALPKRHDRRTSARVTRGQRAKARTPGERRTLIHSVDSDSPNYPFPPTVNPSRVPGNPCYEGVSGSSVARAHSARLGPPHAAISLAHSHLDAGGLLHLAQ
jgi:hypothetical protein